MPAARTLSSPSGEAAEYNVVEGENSQQHAVFWAGGITFRSVTLRYVPYGQTDVEFEIVF